jgi:hypothetical protein
MIAREKLNSSFKMKQREYIKQSWGLAVPSSCLSALACYFFVVADIRLEVSF